MPFSTEQFFEVFREYNISVFPFQVVILMLGTLSIFLIRKDSKFISSFIKGFIIILWLWIGIVYHIIFFTAINKAAYVFGALFVVQGLLFFLEFFIRNKFELIFENKRITYTGYALLIFGAIIYPLIGLSLGKPIEYSIVLGLPCPSVIFTFGIFILCRKSLPKYLLVIPVLWAVIGFFAALKFGVVQDIALPVSALIVLYTNIFKVKNS